MTRILALLLILAALPAAAQQAPAADSGCGVPANPRGPR